MKKIRYQKHKKMSTYFWLIYVIFYLLFVNVIVAYVYTHAYTANNIFWSLEKNT